MDHPEEFWSKFWDYSKIIGDKGLFLNPRRLIPTKSDIVIANKAVIMDIKIPIWKCPLRES